MRVFSGTSGYSYKEWRGAFYPGDLDADAMLRFYAERLPAVEINNTFYRMPKSALMANWREQVPAGFRFVIKASRRITHLGKLRFPEELLGYLWGSIQKLEGGLGAVFFQLPKWLKKDVDLLAAFLEATGGHYRSAVEFQHRSWLDDAVLDVLRAAGAAPVVTDHDGAAIRELDAVTGWGYLRLRRSDYSDADLDDWADRIRGAGWGEAFVFFKHEDGCAGPDLARRFQARFSGA